MAQGPGVPFSSVLGLLSGWLLARSGPRPALPSAMASTGLALGLRPAARFWLIPDKALSGHLPQVAPGTLAARLVSLSPSGQSSVNNFITR